MADLTPAQVRALEVLANHPDQWLGTWKRSTVDVGEPNPRPFKGAAVIARLNTTAANKLAERGLADMQFCGGSVFTANNRFRITADGLAAFSDGGMGDE